MGEERDEEGEGGIRKGWKRKCEGWRERREREEREGRAKGMVSLLITAQESLQDYTNPLSVGALMRDRSISLGELPVSLSLHSFYLSFSWDLTGFRGWGKRKGNRGPRFHDCFEIDFLIVRSEGWFLRLFHAAPCKLAKSIENYETRIKHYFGREYTSIYVSVANPSGVRPTCSSEDMNQLQNETRRK